MLKNAIITGIILEAILIVISLAIEQQLPQWDDPYSSDGSQYQNWLTISTIVIPILMTAIAVRGYALPKIKLGIFVVFVTYIVMMIVGFSFMNTYYSEYMLTPTVTESFLPAYIMIQLYIIITPIKIFVPIIIVESAQKLSRKK